MVTGDGIMCNVANALPVRFDIIEGRSLSAACHGIRRQVRTPSVRGSGWSCMVHLSFCLGAAFVTLGLYLGSTAALMVRCHGPNDGWSHDNRQCLHYSISEVCLYHVRFCASYCVVIFSPAVVFIRGCGFCRGCQ